MEPYPWVTKNSHYVVDTEPGNPCMIINKRFKAPMTTFYEKLLSMQERFDYSIQPNLDFWIRFYFPKSMADAPGTKFSRLVIMFNGLDEILDKHFRVYDQLGSSFASRGIASVLFPTPFHLNRTACIRPGHEIKDGKPQPKLKKPSEELFKNPFSIYMNFIQTLHEYVLFTSLLAPRFKNSRFKQLPRYEQPDEADLEFYENHLNRSELEISLLGYSLGGLKALMCFRSNPNYPKSCILLNSGAVIDKINLKGVIDPLHWQSVTDSIVSEQYPSATLQSLIDHGKHDTIRESHRKIVLKLLRDIRNEDNYAEIRKILVAVRPFNEKERELLGRKLILVIGGRDKIIPPIEIQRLEPEGRSLNVLQISELGHFPDDDHAFNKWHERIVNMLVHLITEPEGTALSGSQLLSLFLAYDWVCDCKLLEVLQALQEPSGLPAQAAPIVSTKLSELSAIDNDVRKIALRGFQSTIEIAPTRISWKELMKELVKHKMQQRLRFGDIAADLHGFDEVEKKQLEEIIKSKPEGTKTGESLADAGYITKRDIDIIRRCQGQKYVSLMGEIPEGKEWLSPVIGAILAQLTAQSHAPIARDLDLSQIEGVGQIELD